MAADNITHFVFVDLENVPGVDLGLVEAKSVHVSLLIGKNQQKLGLDLVRQIQRLGERVELIEVGASGHNALDLTLACYLGKAVQRDPAAHFHIVSRDKDFEPMIGHLRGKDLKVERCESIAALPFLGPRRKPPAVPVAPPGRAVAAGKGAAPGRPPGPAKRPPLDRTARIIARLADPANRNRPATKTRLLAHLVTALGKESTDAKVHGILDELIQRRALTIAPNGRVEYAGPE